MPQDFAKRNAAPAQNPSLPGWVWFGSGLVLGIFISVLAYLWRFAPPEASIAVKPDKPAPAANVERSSDDMQWSFYDLFPENEVAINGGYEPAAAKDGPSHYLLQAGSFRSADDADALRATLILMGMETTVARVRVDGRKWHRVMVGPIDSQLELERAQTRLAEIDVAAIPIRVKP